MTKKRNLNYLYVLLVLVLLVLELIQSKGRSGTFALVSTGRGNSVANHATTC